MDSFMFVFLVSPADSLGLGVLTDLQFEEEGAARPGKAKLSTPQQASQTVRMLCSLTSDPQLVGLKCNRFHSALNCIYLQEELNVQYVSVYLPYTEGNAKLKPPVPSLSNEYDSLLSSPFPARPLLACLCL